MLGRFFFQIRVNFSCHACGSPSFESAFSSIIAYQKQREKGGFLHP